MVFSHLAFPGRWRPPSLAFWLTVFGWLCVGFQTASAQPPGFQPQPPASLPNPTVQNYPVPANQLDAVLGQLRREFPLATGVRIAKDARQSQVVVAAPPAIQQQIAQRLRGFQQPQQPRPQQPPAPVQTALPPSNFPKGPPLTLRNTTWRQLEHSLYRIWGGKMSVSTERDGELATLYWSTPRGLQPVLEIDRPKNTFRTLGAPDQGKWWAKVVQALDRPANANSATRLTPLVRAQPAKVLQAVSLLQSLAAQGQGNPRGRAAQLVFQQNQPQPGQPPAGNQPQPGQPAAQPQPAQPQPGQPAADPKDPKDPNAAAEDENGLIGAVQIEFLEGLDAVIIRGNKRDVERVQRIINDIERVSVENQPTIEVHYLRHVGSQALADLATQIYDQLLAPRQGQVSIRALVKPNALLLLRQTEGVNLVKQLAEQLDKPIRPETQYQIFRLQHVSALDAEQTLTNFFQDRLGVAAQGQGTTQTLRPGLGTRVNVISIYHNNSLLIQASPRDMEEVKKLLTEIDTEDSRSVNQLQIFRLKNALATDIAPVLQDALNWQLIGQGVPLGATSGGQFSNVQGFGQQQAERARLRSAALAFLTVDAKGGKLLKSGVLSNVRVTADANSNALLVTAPAKSMELIGALVKELDRLPEVRTQIKVFTIVNGDANSLATMLQQLLGQSTQQGNQLQNGVGQGNISPFLSPGIQPAGEESSLAPVRFGVEPRTNSIVVSGSESDLGVVEALLLRLDEESVRKRKTTVYWVANLPATEVEEAVTAWLDGRSNIFSSEQDIAPIGPREQLEREVLVVAEDISNSLIISATPRYFDEVTRVVEALDRRPPMIKVDFIIAEVSLGDRNELGAEFGLQDSLLFNRGLGAVGAATNTVGFNFNNVALGNNASAQSLATRDALPGQALSSFGVGRVSSELGYGGLVLSAGNESVSMLIRALQDQQRMQILSRPHIMTLDRQAALVHVGQTVPRVQGTTVTNNVVQQNVADVDVGLLVGVTPQVTPDDQIILQLDAEKSTLGRVQDGIPVGIDQNGNPINSPIINVTEASTTISARSGQTVVFSGLITSSRASISRRVPFLADVPLLGRLFEFNSDSDTRTELLIIMTPHIVRTQEDLDWIRQTETERMSWCMSDVMALQGGGAPLGGHAYGVWEQAPTQVIFPDETPAGVEVVPTPTPAPAAPTTPLDPPPVPNFNSSGQTMSGSINQPVSLPNAPPQVPVYRPQAR